MQTCEKHNFETAKDDCTKCGSNYCDDCLVYHRGPKQAPICINCALQVAGIHNKSESRTKRRQRRKDRKELTSVRNEKKRFASLAAARKRNNLFAPQAEPAAVQEVHWVA